MDAVQWMGEALMLAEQAGAEGEIPIGAVIVDRDGRVVGRGKNRRESGDPLGHAELLAIAEAARTIGDWRLEGTTMVVTLEPRSEERRVGKGCSSRRSQQQEEG